MITLRKITASGTRIYTADINECTDLEILTFAGMVNGYINWDSLFFGKVDIVVF